MSRAFPSSVEAVRGKVALVAEWILVIGLAAFLAGVTLALGGTLAETMRAASRGLWVLTALGVIVFWLRPRELHWAVFVPVPFLLYAFGSALWLAPAPWLAWREWLLWFQTWLVFLLVLHCGRSRSHTLVFVATLAGLGLTGVAMAAYQRFADPTWMMLGRTQAPQYMGRSAGMFGVPNSLAGLMELLIPACLMLAAARRTPAAGRVLAGWLALLFLFALVLTGSRGGWIATLLALVAWPLCVGRNRWRAGLGVIAVLMIFTGVLAAVYHGSSVARERMDPFLAGKFEQSRPIIWRAGVQLWQSAPWWGTGAASYNILFERHRPAHFQHEPHWTHNDYLNTLSDHGLAGFLLWTGAGAVLLTAGWRVWRDARCHPKGGTDALEHWRWKFGLWLGLLAYALHLGVDFHTKIPALAFAGAAVLALLLRCPHERSPSQTSRIPAVAMTVLVAGVAAIAPHVERWYHAEALRFEARRSIDRQARGVGTLDQVLPAALARFQQAVKIDPENGYAWGDLSYAVALSWHVTQGDVGAIGRRAEEAARAALQCSELVAEFWVHLGVALDLQGRHSEAEHSFRQALILAPHRAEWHYYLAYHLSHRPGRSAEALDAVTTCLALDPSQRQANALRERLVTPR